MADRHTIIIAPRNAYADYGVQSESCRMYKDLVAGGVNPDNIILMSTEKISNHKQNPFLVSCSLMTVLRPLVRTIRRVALSTLTTSMIQ